MGARSARKMRSPSHPFNLRTPPFCITPFLVAPVLPGETLTNLLMQSRVVTDPIQSPLIGWWKEYYFYYVKASDFVHKDEDLAANIVDMMINTASTTAATIAASAGGTTAQNHNYYAGTSGNINWVNLMLEMCTEQYFRDEGTLATDHTMTDTITSNAYFVASIVGDNVLDSATLEDDMTAADVAVVDGSDANSTLDASEVQRAMSEWHLKKLYNLTELSYEDYLAAQGVAVPGVAQHQIELIRYLREWSYPTNTIDPTNGTPRSAVSWTIAERADKNRYFKEPGFIFGMTVCRPKVYLQNQTGTFTAAMNDFRAWLPSFINQMDPSSSL